MSFFISRDEQFLLSYSPTLSSIEGKPVTNHISCFSRNQSSIIIPSGTANFTLQINNSSDYNVFVQDGPNVQNVPQNFDLLAPFNNFNYSFTANWIDITSSPIVTVHSKGFFIEGSFRFIRLGGASVTGSSSAACGYAFFDNVGMR